MSARDELARDIFLADNVNAPAGLMEAEWDGNKGDETYAHMIADGLLAFGYRKPRKITAAEEVDALGFMATILDANGCVWVNDGDTLDEWASLGESDSQGGPIWRGSADIALPATVLHEASRE